MLLNSLQRDRGERLGRPYYVIPDTVSCRTYLKLFRALCLNVPFQCSVSMFRFNVPVGHTVVPQNTK